MTAPHKAVFHDEAAARQWLEALLWPNGPLCPHCNALDRATQFEGRKHRAGVWKCRQCSKQFTVTVGTVFERSHIPLNKWLMALYLMSASKKGVSSHQLHRMLDITYKSAWFMTHRLREAMRLGTLPGPLGGSRRLSGQSRAATWRPEVPGDFGFDLLRRRAARRFRVGRSRR